MPNPSDTELGVRAAFEFWLEQHPVTLSDIMSGAIEKQFDTWLFGHTDQLIEAIARQSVKTGAVIPAQTVSISLQNLQRKYAHEPFELLALMRIATELKAAGYPIDTE